MSKCRCRRRTMSRSARSRASGGCARIATGHLPGGAHAKLLSLLGVAVMGRLQVERINCHHFDRRSGLSRHEDHGRNSAVNRKRQSIDQFLVGDHLVVARWQSSIYCLQKEGVLERQRFAVCTRDHAGEPGRRRKKGVRGGRLCTALVQAPQLQPMPSPAAANPLYLTYPTHRAADARSPRENSSASLLVANGSATVL
jgi:hypothetical protein